MIPTKSAGDVRVLNASRCPAIEAEASEKTGVCSRHMRIFSDDSNEECGKREALRTTEEGNRF